MFIRKLPRDVKDQFKAWCVRRGFSMTEVVTRLMTNVVTENKRPDYPEYPSQIGTK